MAYDKIIVIHSRLDRCLDYVQNDGKTDLGNAVDYICDPVKAGFQTAINCTLDKSFLQMQETKRRWDKHGGILGYHIIHSYAPGEVTPGTRSGRRVRTATVRRQIRSRCLYAHRP